MSKQEQFVIGRLKRAGKLFAFLRSQRHVLFDESFQQELELMYRATGEGKVPVAPALLAMVVVLQAYELANEIDESPLSEHLATLAQLRAQDLEPEPPGGKPRIRKGVAEDRRVSVEDPEMRHGRKSSTKRFNGFKSHIAMDIDSNLILACAVMPANPSTGPTARSLGRRMKRGYTAAHNSRSCPTSGGRN